MIKEITIENIKENASRVYDSLAYLVEIIEEEKRSNLKMIEDLKILKAEAEQEADELWKEYEYFADPSDSIATQQALHNRFLHYVFKESDLKEQLEIIEQIQALCECVVTFKNEKTIEESYLKILTIVNRGKLTPENKNFITTLLTR